MELLVSILTKYLGKLDLKNQHKDVTKLILLTVSKEIDGLKIIKNDSLYLGKKKYI